jgi:CRISPR-associated protein Cmr4
MRAHVAATDGDLAKRMFGAADESGGTNSGKVFVGDARLLLFPVSTLKHSFVWATSPLCVSRASRIGVLSGASWTGVAEPLSGHGHSATSFWNGNQIVGAYQLAVTEEPSVQTLVTELGVTVPQHVVFDAVRKKFASDVMVVDDETLRAMAIEGADVVTRIKLKDDQSKQVENLFVEEYLPSESVMAAHLGFDESAAAAKGWDALLNAFKVPIQLGGSTGTGKGYVWLTMQVGQ